MPLILSITTFYLQNRCVSILTRLIQRVGEVEKKHSKAANVKERNPVSEQRSDKDKRDINCHEWTRVLTIAFVFIHFSARL